MFASRAKAIRPGEGGSVVLHFVKHLQQTLAKQLGQVQFGGKVCVISCAAGKTSRKRGDGSGLWFIDQAAIVAFEEGTHCAQHCLRGDGCGSTK